MPILVVSQYVSQYLDYKVVNAGECVDSILLFNEVIYVPPKLRVLMLQLDDDLVFGRAVF